MQPLRPAGALARERLAQSCPVAQPLDLLGRQPGLAFREQVARQQQREPARVEPVGLRLAPATPQRARPTRIDQVHREATLLELARDPAPAGRRLDRDRGQPPLPLHRPVSEPRARGLEPALAQLTRIRIEHHHLEHRLVDIDACVQHLPGPPFVTEVGPRTYRGSWRPPPLHPHAVKVRPLITLALVNLATGTFSTKVTAA